jgi:hypothetical protein
MKYQKILGLVATAGLLLAGCATDSDNSNTWLSDPNAVHVSASVGSIFTRSNPTDEAKQTSFNNGDVMGVSNSGKSINYTFDGTNWQPGNGSYLVWDKSNLKFQCWYPADGKNTFSKGYIQEDQSSATEIAKSDYMTAEVTDLTEIPGDRQLDVTLERKTARLILNIQSFNNQFDASTTKVNHVRIVGKKCTDASETSTINIKPLQNGEGGINTTYTALVAPGTTEGHLYFAAEGTTETPLVVKTGTLVAGKSYTYNLTVGKNKIAINDITVKDWATGEITGGQAELAKTPYITFTAEGTQTFMMTTISPENELYVISGLEYSVNNNDVWKEVVENEPVTFGSTNGTLRLRGTNPSGTAESLSKYSNITFTDASVKVACTGDIRTLLDYRNYKTVATDQARFCKLFYNCKALTSAPDLPAKDLAGYCYCSMFEDCKILKTAPNLLATKLAERCYFRMFAYCESLETAPNLPAESLASDCYGFMFQNCTNLKSTPELRATTLASGCYEGMFQRCTSLVNTSTLLATTLTTYCYGYMFRGCKKLTSVTMLAPSDQISKTTYCCNDWLSRAGTSAASRKLIVQDEAAYNELETNSDYLPAKWKKGATNTTVENYTPKP